LFAGYVRAKLAVKVVKRAHGFVEIASVPQALHDLRADAKKRLLIGAVAAASLPIEGAPVVLQRDGVIVRREVEIAELDRLAVPVSARGRTQARSVASRGPHTIVRAAFRDESVHYRPSYSRIGVA
jgi:hypothetical protein